MEQVGFGFHVLSFYVLKSTRVISMPASLPVLNACRCNVRYFTGHDERGKMYKKFRMTSKGKCIILLLCMAYVFTPKRFYFNTQT